MKRGVKMSRSFGICPKCKADTFEDIPCSRGCGDKTSFLRRLYLRHVPHRTRSKNEWCRPVLYAKVFGGTWDTGNGYAWSPRLWRRESFRFGNVLITKSKPLFGERYGYEKVRRVGNWRFDSLKSNAQADSREE